MTTIVVESYEMTLWEAVAHDPVERDAFLEQYAGLAVDIGERESAEDYIAEARKRWCYRPPVIGKTWTKADNHRTGLPEVNFGPGPIGEAGRQLIECITGEKWANPNLVRKHRP